MLDHLRRVAPEEERLLRDLALGGTGAYEAWGDRDLREAFAFKLERFGLVQFKHEVPRVDLEILRDAVRKPTEGEFEAQKRNLKTLVDAIEGALRVRLHADLGVDRTAAEAVAAVAHSIPSEAKNRALNRQQLVSLGEASGLRSVLEALNWGDYEVLLNKEYDAIAWSGPELTREERLGLLKMIFQQAHLVRHNNDHELRELITVSGYSELCGRFCSVLDMVSGTSGERPKAATRHHL